MLENSEFLNKKFVMGCQMHQSISMWHKLNIIYIFSIVKAIEKMSCLKLSESSF